MRSNTITAAAILAFTSIAVAIDVEGAGSAPTAVAEPVAQVNSETNIVDNHVDRSGLRDDIEEDGEGEELQKRFQKYNPYKTPNLDRLLDSLRKDRTQSRSGAEMSNMGPGGRPQNENKDQHGRAKRDLAADHEDENKTKNEDVDEQEYENSAPALQRRADGVPKFVWDGHPGVIKDHKTGKIIFDSRKDASKIKIKAKGGN